MEKKDLVEAISKRAAIKSEQAEIALDQVLAEVVSTHIFGEPGGEVGLINDNNCHNNCPK